MWVVPKSCGRKKGDLTSPFLHAWQAASGGSFSFCPVGMTAALHQGSGRFAQVLDYSAFHGLVHEGIGSRQAFDVQHEVGGDFQRVFNGYVGVYRKQRHVVVGVEGLVAL